MKLHLTILILNFSHAHLKFFINITKSIPENLIEVGDNLYQVLLNRFEKICEDS